MKCPDCGRPVPAATGRCPSCGTPAFQGLDRAAAAFADQDAVTILAAPADAAVTRLGGSSSTPPPGIAPSSEAATPVDGMPPQGGDHPAARTLFPGQPFGSRYHVVKLLGVGGMGAVYQAWDTELGVVVALKVIRPEIAADPEAAAILERRFKQELLLARQVTHKNVVRIHELGEMDGIKYITMPLIEGEDLASVLRRQEKLPVDQVLKIARGLASGLEAAHAAGVVHRDLKPENLRVDMHGEVMIMDFGIARSTGGTQPGVEVSGPLARIPLTSDETMAGTVVGTVEFMAPEQARAQPVDQRADIYAFGLILNDMLLGPRRTASGDAFAELRKRMESAPPAPRTVDPSIPEPLSRIIARCIEPDAAKRFQSTTDLVAALDRLDDRGHLLPVVRRVTRRLTAEVLLVVLALLALTWWLAHTPPPETERPPLSVLMADFTNATGEPVFDGVLEQALTVGIEGARFISAYQRPAALRTARLLGARDRLDESTARLVALREGIKVVLVGSIEKRGSGYTLSVRGLDPSSSKELVSARATARNRNAVLSAGGTLAGQLRSALGDTRAPDPRDTITSASLEAVAAFTRGLTFLAAGNDQEALAAFTEATERDPGFVRAHGGMALALTRLGRHKDAELVWKTALAAKDRMTDRERYRLEGVYFQLVTRDYNKAIDTYRALVKEYPADGPGHNNLAVGYFRRLEFANALEEGRLLLGIFPGNPLYRSNHALYAMYAGKFSLASTEAQKLIDDGQATYDAYLPIAVSAIADNKVDVARAAYELMAKVDASGASLASVGLADLALAEGRAAEASAILQRGIKVDEQQRNPAAVATKRIALADALGMLGDVRGAVAASRAALAIDNTEAQIIPAARWLIAAGKVDDAADLGQVLDKRLEPQARAYRQIVTAQIALARGKRADAVDALREALKFADLWLARFYLGQAYLDAGYFNEASSEFELCRKRSGEGYAAFLDDIPTARYMAVLPYWIGRAHEGYGLAGQARADYEAFLKMRSAGAKDSLTLDARRRLMKR